MPHLKLTKSNIDKVPLAENGQMIYFDTEMPGFGLRVGKTKKTFFVQRDINAKTYASTIGVATIWTPDQARQEARERLLMLSKGIDPNEAKRQESVKQMTLRAVMEEFFVERNKLKPRTRDSYRDNIERYLVDWLDKPITDITEDKFSKKYRYIGENNGKTVANNVRRILSSMINFYIASHKLFDDRNPTRIIADTKSGYKENRRRTYIKNHQLKPWYAAVNNLPNRTYRDYLLLILFTGLRRREGASLLWSQIDFEARTLIITETKNSEILVLPLSDFLFDLLKNRKTLTGDSAYVFPSTGKHKFLCDPRLGVEAVTKTTGIVFSIHDLRRTFITVAESLDISTYALKSMLNHKSSNDITGSYIMIDVERLRQPVESVALKIQEYINRPD